MIHHHSIAADAMTHAKFERLERRRLLSGNVTVTADETLAAHLIGDNKNNEIEITVNPGIGYFVTGLHGTTVNGVHAVSIATTPALKFEVSLGNGNDRVFFEGAFGTQDLNIITGNGKDVVSLSGGTHFGDINIDTGNGDDQVILSGIHGTKNLNVSTGDGKDTLSVPSPIQIDGSAKIDGGKAKNKLTGNGAINASTTISVQHFDLPKANKATKKHGKKTDD
jgi:hypothetical protein